MDIVVNRSWGSFHIPKEIANKRGLSVYDDIDRTDKELVNWANTNTSSLHVFLFQMKQLTGKSVIMMAWKLLSMWLTERFIMHKEGYGYEY